MKGTASRKGEGVEYRQFVGKAGDGTGSSPIYIKAVGDWELEILGVPYGLDNTGEYFDDKSNLHLDKYPEIPLVYYHGFDPDGKPSGKPEYIGKAKVARVTPEGVWYRGVLDRASAFAQRVWEAAKEKLARASSGSIAHLVRIADNGHIEEWPVAELTLMDLGDKRQPAHPYAVALPVMKTMYETAGLDLPDSYVETSEAPRAGAAVSVEPTERKVHGVKTMTEKVELSQAEIDALKAQGRKELENELAEEAKREQELADAKAEAVKAYQEEQEAKEKEKEAEAVKARRLPEVPENVQVAKMAELYKYDHLTPEDQAVLVGVLDAADKGGTGSRASDNAYKALAVKISEDKDINPTSKQAMKMAGIKADEIQQQDLTSYGDEWVGVAYSNALWEAIRMGTFVAQNIPSIEVPAGHESVVIPLESGDPTFYKVAEATDSQTSGWPNTTITSSQMGTAKKTLSLSKMGARVLWSGELQEDSIIPFVAQLRMQLAKAGAEQLEHSIIDGDNATAASTNINDIAATGAQAGTELHLLYDGFRVSPLVTTTANSRSGGALTAEDFLETVKLMGAGGINAAAIDKVAFIVDMNTYWKALELDEVKSRDVYVQPTLEDGMLNGLWGYKLYRSPNMHLKSAVRKANTAGKIDQDTTGNNTTGSILAVRWDQWLLGYRRRMTLETTRIARADATEIVALARLGLVQRDTEASAITYNVTV